MTDSMSEIANRVRGVAAEKRFTQTHIANTLGIARGSVNARINGSVPFTAAEILTLAQAMNVPVTRFFPEVAERAA